VLVVNLHQRLTAYVNECAHEALPLDNAVLDVDNGTLTCPWHGFCYDAASGECLTAPAAQLEQLPLRIDDGHVWIRVGT
jgi:nitrite reductase/ring-hydroxylating ferredoxin subunit